MKKSNSVFQVICIATILCSCITIIIAIRSAQFGAAIMIIAFCVLLAFICFLCGKCAEQSTEKEEEKGFNKIAVVRIRDLNEEGIIEGMDFDGQKRSDEIERLCKVIERLCKVVEDLKEKTEELQRIAVEKRKTDSEKKADKGEKRQFIEEKKSDNRVNSVKDSVSSGRTKYPMDKATGKGKVQTRENRQVFLVNVDSESLRNEIREGNKIKLYRHGAGVCQLINFEELIPDKLVEGKKFTNDMFDKLKAYHLFKIFELNSSSVIGHKIIKVEAAEFCVSEEIEVNTEAFEVILKKKGKIEVDNPTNNENIL